MCVTHRYSRQFGEKAKARMHFERRGKWHFALSEFAHSKQVHNSKTAHQTSNSMRVLDVRGKNKNDGMYVCSKYSEHGLSFLTGYTHICILFTRAYALAQCARRNR